MKAENGLDKRRQAAAAMEAAASQRKPAAKAAAADSKAGAKPAARKPDAAPAAGQSFHPPQFSCLPLTFSFAALTCMVVSGLDVGEVSCKSSAVV